MKILEVQSEKDRKDFLSLPERIYKDDLNWIRPLDNDIESVFDEKKNKFFRHGRCMRFLLKDSNDKVIGRIAAFINERTSKKESQPTGGIGFFECINDKQSAHFMFDYCQEWLKQRGMEAMDGPVNFGERDSWWGLITDGFTPPQYKMNYNPPYYIDLFESYGFKTYFEQWCYSRNPKIRPQEKFLKRHDDVAANKDFRAEHLRKKNLDKYAEDFRTIYNKAWAKHGVGKELDSKQVKMFFKKMKPVIDEKIIWYVYYKHEPVAFWVNLPDINQLFRRFNGKFGWWQKLQFFILLKRKVIKKFIGLVFGVVPEFQGQGIESFLIVEGANLIQNEELYDEFEMQWIGDFNPKMISVAESLGPERTRVLKTYRYLFDRTKEFKRHPFL
jgi:hypothetical protein